MTCRNGKQSAGTEACAEKDASFSSRLWAVVEASRRRKPPTGFIFKRCPECASRVDRKDHGYVTRYRCRGCGYEYATLPGRDIVDHGRVYREEAERGGGTRRGWFCPAHGFVCLEGDRQRKRHHDSDCTLGSTLLEVSVEYEWPSSSSSAVGGSSTSSAFSIYRTMRLKQAVAQQA